MTILVGGERFIAWKKIISMSSFQVAMAAGRVQGARKSSSQGVPKKRRAPMFYSQGMRKGNTKVTKRARPAVAGKRSQKRSAEQGHGKEPTKIRRRIAIEPVGDDEEEDGALEADVEAAWQEALHEVAVDDAAEDDVDDDSLLLARHGENDQTLATPDEDDQFFVEALELSRLSQFGPATKNVRSKKMSGIFLYTEEKPERLTDVVQLISDTYNEAVGHRGPCATALAPLNLEGRGEKALTFLEAQTLTDHLMIKIDLAMVKARYEGLQRALVELEVLHVRKLLSYEPWFPKWRAKGKKTTDPEKDGMYYLVYRRNSEVVLREGQLVIYKFANLFGLQNVYIRPTTLEYLELAEQLRDRTKRGILVLDRAEIEDLEMRRDLQEIILTRLSEDDLINITVANSVPWIRSHSAVAILAARVMGIVNWREMLKVMRENLMRYGLTAWKHRNAVELKEYADTIKKAKDEHNSPVHWMIRLLGKVLKVDPGYLTAASQADLSDTALREVANGSKFATCIVASRKTGQEETLYTVHIGGQAVAYVKSLTKAYYAALILQNLLFLDGGSGSKSITPLVESLNLLAFGIQYRRPKLGARYKKLIGILDAKRNMDQARQELMPESQQ